MKKIIVLLSLTLLLACCKTIEKIKYITVKEVHTEEVIIRDTIVDIQLIPYHDSISVTDTVSYLENKYAYSYAGFSQSKLNHSLTIKHVNTPVKIQYIERIVRDSIQVPVQVKGETVVMYKRDVFWWIGLGAIALVVGMLIYKLIWFARK